jgi:[ribosomal protein S5]-alanine N-acetyltransferase
MQSSRLKFRKFEQADFISFLQLVSDEDVMRLITGRAFSEETAWKRFEDHLRINEAYPDLGYYFISVIATDQFIGLGKIVITKDDEAEIGYSLLPEFWSKGFGSEICKELVGYCRTLTYIKKLIAITDPENMASGKILTKCNFILDEICMMDNLPAEIYRLDLDKT